MRRKKYFACWTVDAVMWSCGGCLYGCYEDGWLKCKGGFRDGFNEDESGKGVDCADKKVDGVGVLRYRTGDEDGEYLVRRWGVDCDFDSTHLEM